MGTQTEGCWEDRETMKTAVFILGIVALVIYLMLLEVEQ